MATEPTPDAIEVSVARTDPAAAAVFRVERTGSMVVLDLLVAIQRRHDPTLAFRWSCRIAACGTCTVRVDGRPVLACQAIVGPAMRRTRIEPLGGLPVVRDLVVDLAPFQARWAAAGPSFDGDGQAPTIAPQGVDANLDCIACGACFAACGMASDGVPFLGPAALNRAFVLAADPRATDVSAHLDRVAGDHGLEGCHGIGACTLVCPKGLDPAGSIRGLRRLRVGARRPAT